MHAHRRTGPVRIDGRVDEEAWRTAPSITDFVQQDPDEGAAPSERTDVRILYDDEALYVGARLYSTVGRSGVRAVLTRRDEILQSDSGQTDKIVVSFDTFRNRTDETTFELNPLGVKGDEQSGDPAYDPVWVGAASIDSTGWSAEFRIPFSQLHFSRDREQNWGMQIWRFVARRRERDMWAFWRKNEFGGPAHYGVLAGIQVPVERRRLEVIPYATSRATSQPPPLAGASEARSRAQVRAGGDAKLNVTSNLTLDATVNPDFGQVEVDPAVVNLTAFETILSERRPFFTSGSQYFAFGGPDCLLCFNGPGAPAFYTRRIGRAPELVSVVEGSGGTVDAPDATTILAAGKVTGRTGAGLGVGAIEAVTDRATAQVGLTGGESSRMEVEPLSNYFVGRLRQSVRDGRVGVGVLLTRVDRDLTTPLERAWLRANATFMRFDADQHSADRAYNTWFGVGVSQVGGDTAAIRRTQESSAHYFQRPGRRLSRDGLFDVAYDPTRTHLRGFITFLRAGKDAGDWQGEFRNFVASPGAEINDLGILRRADDIWTDATLRRVWSTPASWYHAASVMFGGEDHRDFENHETGGEVNLGGDLLFPNYWMAQLQLFRRPTYDDPGLLRGGPIEKRYGYTEGHLFVTTDQRRPVVGNVMVGGGIPIDNNEGGGRTATVGMTFKPSAQAVITLSGSFVRDMTAQQYITRITDATAPAAFAGSRYVFGRVVQNTLSLPTRVNAAFTPDLTLEVYAEPFVSSGAYSDFKEFAGVDTKSMMHYGIDNGSTMSRRSPTDGGASQLDVDPDGPGPSPGFSFADPSFTYRSVRGTAVLRWEYRPGSTLFLVWTQQREGSENIGSFDVRRDVSALYRDRPTNILQLKVTYWLGR
ncbi:MAG TPA: DUF5916 domain-containing protein [Gemmatimonadaceae bacterium]|nr:DUF5916 domain-containing protein [Gemmatimonadaceae bacterium]